MAEFDWEEAKSYHSPEVYAFLLDNHDKLLSEDEFVADYMAIPKISKAGNLVVRHNRSARHQFNRLKNKFGFFGGTN